MLYYIAYKIIVQLNFILHFCYIFVVQFLKEGNMKWSELKRIAEEKGWKLMRHGSNHDKEEIKNGTAHKLFKQIGI